MKYTENGLTFSDVKKGGISFFSGPLVRSGLYNELGGDIMLKTMSEGAGRYLLNCIDIDWNGVKVDLNITLNDTSDLLNWIKNIKSENYDFDGSPLTVYRWYKKGTIPEAPTDVSRDEPRDINNEASPTENWSKNIPSDPSTNNLKWDLWTSTSTKYINMSGEEVRTPWSKPVCITGGGERNIVRTTTYYLASSLSTGVTINSSGWSTSILNLRLTSTNKYLWLYQKIEYDSGDPSYIGPMIIDTYNDGSNINLDLTISAYRWYTSDVTQAIAPTDLTNDLPDAVDHTNDNKASLKTKWTSTQPVRPAKTSNDDTTVWKIWMTTTTKHIVDGVVTRDNWSTPICLGTGKSVGEMGGELPEELEEEVEAIRKTVEDVEQALDDIHVKSKQDVQEAVDEMFDTWDWFLDKGFPIGEAFKYYYDSSDELAEGEKAKMREVFEGLGFLKDDDNGVTFTKIKQFVNGGEHEEGQPWTLAELSTSVGDITKIIDPNDPSGINYETLGTEVSQKITQDVNGLKEALLDLQAFWGTTDEDKELMQYMKSAFSAAASQYQTAATMFSDMEDAAGNTATSAVKTAIGIDANGNLTAGGLLASKIQQGVNNAASGFAYKSDINEAFAQMFAKAGQGEEDDPKHTNLIAAVRTAVNSNEGGLKTAIASLVATPNPDDLKAALAGVFVECDENGENSLVNIIARDENGIGAKITATVKNHRSELGLTASDVGITAEELKVAVQNAGITAQSLNITADDVHIDATTTLTGKLNALEGLITTSATANILHAWSGDITTEFDENSAGSHVLISDGTIQGYENTKPALTIDSDGMPNGTFGSYAFNKTGSGYIANGNIKWDADGDIVLNSKKINAGSKYNTLDIYKWTLRPISFDSAYQSSNPYLSGLEGKFNYELMIGYRIIKNGFVVKDGMYRTESVINPPTTTPQEFHGGPYFNEGGLTGRSWNNITQQWEESHYDNIYYILYGYKYSSITSASALNFLKQVKTDASDLFNGMFKLKENDSSYIFDSGDTLYVSFPDNIVSYDPKIVKVDQIEGFNYNTNESTGKVTAVDSWMTESPILWANTTSSSSPYLHDILILMLTDLVGSSKASTIFNDLFNYSDDPDSVLKQFAGWEGNNTSYEDNIGKLNVNAKELYLVWKYKDVTTANYTTEFVEQWNLHKTNYIEALNSGNYSKGNVSALSNSDLMGDISNAENRPGFTNYYDYSIYKASSEFDKIGNTLSPVLKPLISDAEIVVNWEDVIAE